MSQLPAIDAAVARFLAACQAGDFAAAEAAGRELTRLAPTDLDAWMNLGLVQLQLGKLEGAETSFRTATGLDAASAGAWHNLSVVLREQNRVEEAEACARQAVAIDASSPAIWLNLANTLYHQARWDDAAAAYQQALGLDPQQAAAWCNLGATEQLRGQPAAALAAYEQSLALAPDDPLTLTNLAQLLTDRGELERARAVLLHLLERQPQLASAWVALSNVLDRMGDLPAATTACMRALSLTPGDLQAQQNLALFMRSERSLPIVESMLQQVLASHPNDPASWMLLGHIRGGQARQDESLAAMRRAIGLPPANADRHGKYLFSLQNAAGITPEVLLAEHRAWAATFAEPLAPSPPPVRRPAANRLRLGFVSPDFGLHPIGFMVLPLLEHLDKSQCHVTCYSDRRTPPDDYTQRFQTAADAWRDTLTLAHEQLAAQVRADEIDVLVDLAGHTGRRVPAFALRAAPVQATWFGYVGTTGLATMDYLIADRWHVPPGDERHYVERILRLPHGYACYGPPADAPAVGPLPVLATGQFTFGCFNGVFKYTPQHFDIWAEILRRVPAARLLLKYNGLNQVSIQEDLWSRFADRGIARERIVLEGWSPNRELLASYGRVDLALDTQPYSGGLTTCETLWMGVPVVTFPGQTFAGRHSLSHLTNAGCEQFVAPDAAGYVDLAVAWASRLEELSAIRAGLREQVRRSPLCDAPKFARDWLNLIRAAVESAN